MGLTFVQHPPRIKKTMSIKFAQFGTAACAAAATASAENGDKAEPAPEPESGTVAPLLFVVFSLIVYVSDLREPWLSLSLIIVALRGERCVECDVSGGAAAFNGIG